MASNPGPLINWSWQKLGNFKYMVLSPLVAHSLCSIISKEEGERDVTILYVYPFLLWRMLHSQLWISFARYQTSKTSHRIVVDKGIEFEQVDRERNWDDQIILSGIIGYIAVMYVPWAARMPMWRWDGLVLTILLHTGPVEFLYYWFHRALHHHFRYSRYHSHHHLSIVTEPITCISSTHFKLKLYELDACLVEFRSLSLRAAVTHPFGEMIVYYILFFIPILAMLYTGSASVSGIVRYITYIDFMNYMGHYNFELVPNWVFNNFPILKYFMYTSSFHSLHHTKFRTNYSLFMPLYDYIYGTMDKSTDKLYETSLKGSKETTDVVHLTHPTTLQSFYQLPPAIASLASKPYSPKWYMWMLWPIPYGFMFLTWVFGSTFTVERNVCLINSRCKHG